MRLLGILLRKNNFISQSDVSSELKDAVIRKYAEAKLLKNPLISYRTRNHGRETYPGFRGVYVISVAAKMARMHPQTLRKYERYGFVSPNRTSGSQRLYSDIDVNRLLVAKRLIDEFGLNLNGVRLILEILDVINAWKNILKRDPQISKFQDVREIVDGIDTLINQIYNRKTK